MGTFKFRKKKDWKANFRKKETKAQGLSSVSVSSLSMEAVYNLDSYKSDIETRFDSLNLHERNLHLFEAATNIFNLSKVNWAELKRSISGEQVRELYNVVEELWPPDTDLISLLPSPDSSLRALYLGDVNPHYIARNIFRFGLYADEIFIVNPFFSPHAYKDKFNPLIHPDSYKADTLKLLGFMTEVSPWVNAGLVTLIPDPRFFDVKLMKETLELAEERKQNFEFKDEDYEDSVQEGKDEVFRILYALPKHTWVQTLREKHPGITEQEIEDIYALIERRRKEDPLALDQEGAGSQMIGFRAGLDLATSIFLSQEAGAFPYTNLKMKWRELLSFRKEFPDVAEVWSPLTKGFQELEFRFLDNVDSRFAFEMRDSGRLDSFRSYLRRIWKSIGQEAELSKVESAIRDFRDELTGEYHKAQAEWKKIDTDLLTWVGTATSGAIAAGALSLAPPVPPVLGAASLGIFKLLESHRKRGHFRQSVPLSVFVDLSGRKNRKEFPH